MGTTALLRVYDEDEQVILALERNADGYDFGSDIHSFIKQIKLVNGLGRKDNVANGMGCLAAQLVSHFKVIYPGESTSAGLYYIAAPSVDPANYDYAYDLRKGKLVGSKKNEFPFHDLALTNIKANHT